MYSGKSIRNNVLNWRLKAGVFILLSLFSCKFPANKETDSGSAKVTIIGSLKQVMREGRVGPKISLDTIGNKKNLFGLGPESYLKGELLIWDGQSFVSRANTDSTLTVVASYNVTSPFFAYVNVAEWHPVELPSQKITLPGLESYFREEGFPSAQPLPFMLKGIVTEASIHVLRPPPGEEVTHEAAHKGKLNHVLRNEEVTVFGFYSRDHQGILTHHDSGIHAHLINSGKDVMGHLDELVLERAQLSLASAKRID